MLFDHSDISRPYQALENMRQSLKLADFGVSSNYDQNQRELRVDYLSEERLYQEQEFWSDALVLM